MNTETPRTDEVLNNPQAWQIQWSNLQDLCRLLERELAVVGKANELASKHVEKLLNELAETRKVADEHLEQIRNWRKLCPCACDACQTLAAYENLVKQQNL